MVILIPFQGFSSDAREIWIPSPGQPSPDGKIIFNLVFQESNLGEGFFPIQSGRPYNFKRILAVPGKWASPNLVEYSPDLFLPSENPAGYLVVEDSNKILKGQTRNEAGFLVKRFAPTLKDAQDLPEIDDIPLKIEDFSKWKPGDSIVFRKKEVLKVNAAYGANTFYDFGVVSSISANWDVLIRLPYKTENPENKQLVFVSYSIPEGSNYRYDKGGFQENVNLFKLWGQSKTFKFIFDLSNKKIAPPLKIVSIESNQKTQEIVENSSSLIAYQEALRGNLILANLLSQRKIYGVRKIFEEEEEVKQSAKGFKIPWEMDVNFRKGKYFISGKAITLPGNLLLENVAVHYSQDFANLQKESLSSNPIKTFVGFFQQINNTGKIGGTSNRRFSATLKFQINYSNIHRDQYFQDFKNSFLDLGFLDDSLLPNPLKGKMGNLELNLDVILSNVAIDVLMNLPDEYPENVLINEANDYVIEHFKNKTDSNNEICENYGEKDLNKCIFICKKRTFQAMTNAYRALKDMKLKRDDRNYEEFLRSFGKFGTAFAENRYSLITFLRFIGHNFRPNLQGLGKFWDPRFITVDGKKTLAPLEIKIQIKGPNISPFIKKFRNTSKGPNI